MSNNLTGSPGRLCNHILRALPTNIVSKKYNLKFNYGQYYDKMKELGIDLYTEGINTYNNTMYLNDIILFNMIISDDMEVSYNINVHPCYCQQEYFSNYFYNYYKDKENRSTIIEANKFKERYNNNNDVFIHIRLTDTAEHNPGYEYYDKAISNINYTNGYISSDDIEHEICQKLIDKYNLKIINYDEIETIMFGSTCKNIILTGGSFSFVIGLFGFFSNIYYCNTNKETWYPLSMYYINDWNGVNI